MSDKSKGKGQQTPMDSYEKTHGDSGVTIGNRKSAIYGRIYDWALKHQREKHGCLWRYEIELKQEAAFSAWERYRESSDPSKLCAEMVNTRLQKWGIVIDEFKNLEPAPISGTRPMSDDERRLIYVIKVVAPMLGKLIENGHSAKLRAIFEDNGLLGFDGTFCGETIEEIQKRYM